MAALGNSTLMHACTCAYCTGGSAGDYRNKFSCDMMVCLFVGAEMSHPILLKPLDATSSWVPRTARTQRTPENTAMVQGQFTIDVCTLPSFYTCTTCKVTLFVLSLFSFCMPLVLRVSVVPVWNIVLSVWLHCSVCAIPVFHTNLFPANVLSIA